MYWLFSFCKTKKTKNEKRSRRDNRKMTTRREPPTKIRLNADKGPRTKPLLSATARRDLDDAFFM